MKNVIFLVICLVATSNSPLFAKNKISRQGPTSINFTQNLPNNGSLVLGVYMNNELTQTGKAIDKQSQNGLSHAIKAVKFEGKANTTKLITAPMGSGFDQILLVGLGEKAKEKSDLKWQEIGGFSAQKAVSIFKSVPPMVFDRNLDEHSLSQIAFGAKLGTYFFDKYYTDSERHKSQTSLKIVSNKAEEVSKYFKDKLNPLADAVWYTRDISNEPANIIYPESFINRWKKHFRGMKKTKIKIFDEKDMLKKGMGAIYGVGRGSARPPRMMVVEYNGGNKNDAPIVIVGKGITFDTGGISIKGSKNMWNMKFDMSGAASALGTVYALAGRKANVNVVAIAALAENMPGANAQRPGDVVKSMSGKTIQIRSTDAEGRLVLADAIHYGDVTYNPKLLIDLATLTGSASRALGKDYAALFTRHQDLVGGFLTAGKSSGEEVWQLPLNKNHFKAIENNVADVMNSGPTAPGASAGAAFVGAFVRESTQWVHFDIAGVAWNDKTNAMKASPGSTSYGVRLLNEYISTNYEK